MSTLINFEIKALPAMRVIGKPIRPMMDMKENPIPAFWGQCFGDGTFAALESIPSAINGDYVGFMCDWTNPTGVFTYIVGMLFEEGTAVPEGFAHWDCPACTAAIGWIQGPEKETFSDAHNLTQTQLDAKGYKMNPQAGWCMELYNCPRFTVPQENGDVILDYYIPCVPAKS